MIKANSTILKNPVKTILDDLLERIALNWLCQAAKGSHVPFLAGISDEDIPNMRHSPSFKYLNHLGRELFIYLLRGKSALVSYSTVCIESGMELNLKNGDYTTQS